MHENDILQGRYHIIERLGNGANGTVWSAEERVRGRTLAKVAIKEFSANVSLDEMAVLASLRHPNILSYIATIEENRRLYLVTELAEGGSAERLLQAYPKGLPPEQVAHLISQIAQVLQYLHESRLVHRDVKPANILLVEGNIAKLGDVQTVKAVQGSATQHSGMGSQGYAAPEMFENKVEPRSDVYSLGVTAYELLTGRLPFEGNPAAVMKGHLTKTPTIPPELPNYWRAALMDCLEKQPERRCSAAQLVEALKPKPTPQITTNTHQPAQATPTAPKDKTSAPQAAPQEKPQQTASAIGSNFLKALKGAFVQAAEQRKAILQWEAQLAGWVLSSRGRLSPQEWQTLVNNFPGPKNEAALVAQRDAMVLRMFPPSIGAKREIALSDEISLRLIYLPRDMIKNHPRLSRVVGALSKSESIPPTTPPPRGIWITPLPLTRAQWGVLCQGGPPPDNPNHPTTMNWSVLQNNLLPAISVRYPLESFRLPTFDEATSMHEIVQKKQEAQRVAPVKSTKNGSLLSAIAAVGLGVVNKFGEEMREWYGDMTPDLLKTMEDRSIPCRLVSPLPDLPNPTR